MPYESQIFQNMFIDYIRKKIHKAKTFGYVHDFEPVTPNLFHNSFSPDYLFLPGKGRKRYLILLMTCYRKQKKLELMTKKFNYISDLALIRSKNKRVLIPIFKKG